MCEAYKNCRLQILIRNKQYLSHNAIDMVKNQNFKNIFIYHEKEKQNSDMKKKKKIYNWSILLAVSV